MVKHDLLAKIMVIHITQVDVTEDSKDNKDNKETMPICKEPQFIKIENTTNVIKNKVDNTIKTNTKEQKQKEKQKKHHNYKPCWCYNRESQDMRCCGVCYICCYNPNKEEQCYMCPETFEIYYTSGYVITTCGYGRTNDECEDCMPTTLCLPLKLAFFWPCLFGSIFNNCINYCRTTDTNYLF
jgi:hypothetical protein